MLCCVRGCAEVALSEFLRPGPCASTAESSAGADPRSATVRLEQFLSASNPFCSDLTRFPRKVAGGGSSSVVSTTVDWARGTAARGGGARAAKLEACFNTARHYDVILATSVLRANPWLGKSLQAPTGSRKSSTAVGKWHKLMRKGNERKAVILFLVPRIPKPAPCLLF